MIYVHLLVVLGLVEYFVFGGFVGAARRKFSVDPPLMTGPSEFERVVRIHQNTLEQLMMFIPGILGFAHYVSPSWAALFGTVFLVGRIVYFLGYRRSAERRVAGALMTLLSNLVLLAGALVGVVLAMAAPT